MQMQNLEEGGAKGKKVKERYDGWDPRVSAQEKGSAGAACHIEYHIGREEA